VKKGVLNISIAIKKTKTWNIELIFIEIPPKIKWFMHSNDSLFAEKGQSF